MLAKKKILLKFFAAVLSLCMALTFTACNKEEETSTSSTSEEDQTPPRKVGYIFHGDADDEYSFAGQMSAQRVMASNRSSMDTCYIDGVSILDFEKAVKKLVDYGCTDIVTCNDVYSNILNSVASKYMNINFIGYGKTSSGSPNVAPYTEQSYEGAYVAGMVAAYNSITRKIGFVGDSNLIYLNANINAAALGTQLVFSNAELMTVIASKDNEIRQGIDDLIAKGCDVIVCYTATDYAEEYCQQRGIEFISNLNLGDRADELNKMIMYWYCKRDGYFLSQFKDLRAEKWAPLEYVGTMANGIVTVSTELNEANAQTQDIIDALCQKIVGGINIFSGQLIDNEDVPRYLQNEEMTESQVYTMDWYVKGVTIVGNYRKPQNQSAENPLEIKT